MKDQQPDMLNELARRQAQVPDTPYLSEDDAISTRKLTDQQRFDCLRLIRSENVGPATFYDLCQHFGSAANALKHIPDLSRKGGAKRAIRMASIEETEKEWEQIARGGARLVAFGEPDYPRNLSFIHAPPPILSIVGDADCGHRPSVSMVGSRNCSASGLKLTDTFARELGEHGVVVVSGLARGIDTAAHKASLNTGTIAVVAGGLNQIYPKENIKLAHTIAERGLLISEMPWNWQARAQDFPRRNRIISGIAHGTLVIEAAKRSGSLITARYALEQGREVFAIPGSPLDPRSGGTNHLIKQGACLVCETEDILTAMSARLVPQSTYKPLFREEPDQDQSFDYDCETEPQSRDRFIQSLGPTPIAVDELIRLSGLTPAQAQVTLLELDLAGRLERHGNQSVSLKPV